jgi:YHS domain-containing protein
MIVFTTLNEGKNIFILTLYTEYIIPVCKEIVNPKFALYTTEYGKVVDIKRFGDLTKSSYTHINKYTVGETYCFSNHRIYKTFKAVWWYCKDEANFLFNTNGWIHFYSINGKFHNKSLYSNNRLKIDVEYENEYTVIRYFWRNVTQIKIKSNIIKEYSFIAYFDIAYFEQDVFFKVCNVYKGKFLNSNEYKNSSLIEKISKRKTNKFQGICFPPVSVYFNNKFISRNLQTWYKYAGDKVLKRINVM